MKSRVSLRMAPLNWFSFLLATKLLAAVGHSNSRGMLMDPLSVTKGEWWPKDILNAPVLISLKHLLQHPNGQHSELSWHWLHLRISILRVWTSHLHSSMEPLRKTSTCASHLGLLRKAMTGCGTCRNPSMG